ncbi:hypothetical protein [Streptomyces sp. RFCAC02]|uniref:hypothetical protein n=1 Tax=Streptomyces sp. RFCAC02 TaxID=2499143 RepID=UPI0010216324|nr:hypothetical protein [Streptomyces sp. RFCAC02]
MSRYLIDEVAVGWEALGTDLLDGAPEEVRTRLIDSPHPSQHLVLHTPDGTPPQRMTTTEANTEGLEWAYLLRPAGIHVIHLPEGYNALAPWDTNPLSPFSDDPARWAPARRTPSAGRGKATPARAEPTSRTAHRH